MSLVNCITYLLLMALACYHQLTSIANSILLIAGESYRRFFALKLSLIIQYNQSIIRAGCEKIVCNRISMFVKPAPTKNIPTKPDKQLLRANCFYQP